VEVIARGVETTPAVQPRPERDRVAGGIQFVAGRDGGNEPRQALRRDLHGDDLGRREVALDRAAEGHHVLVSAALAAPAVGEFDDSALAKEFGRRGAGIFVGPSVLTSEIEKQFGVKSLGTTADVVEEFFAISVERRVTHPCVVAIAQSAREGLFAPPSKKRGGRRSAPQ